MSKDELLDELRALCEKHGIDEFIFAGRDGEDLRVRIDMQAPHLVVTLKRLAEDIKELVE